MAGASQPACNVAVSLLHEQPINQAYASATCIKSLATTTAANNGGRNQNNPAAHAIHSCCSEGSVALQQHRASSTDISV